MSKIELTHIDKYYGKNHVLKDLNLTIEDGDFMTLLGPSGCGKTTTLRVVSGLEKPQSGIILMDGKEIVNAAEASFAPPSKRNLNLVFQSYALWPHMTVFDNVAFGLRIRKENSETIAKKVASALDRMQIGEFAKRYPTELSGGQQQRVAIARAIVSEPRLLLLDEPLSNLDARLRLEMREEIRRIQTETGVTTVFVTHDQEEAMSITDEIVLMRTGVVQQQCPPQQMYLNPANRFVAGFLGNPPINFFRLDVCGGTVCLAEDYMLRVRGAADGPVLVGIRPEAWRLGQGLRTAAEAVEMRGKDLLVTFSLAGERARAILDITAGVAAGDAVELTLEPRLVYIFDPETGARLDAEVAG